MKSIKKLPIDWLITDDMLIEDLLYQIETNPHLKAKNGTIKINKRNMKIIFRLLYRCIMFYLKECEIFDDGRIEVQLFPGLRLYSYDEPGKTITNKLNGDKIFQSPRRRYGAYFNRYHQRIWNKLDY